MCRYRARMDVQSLGFRTELPLLETSGSQVVDRGTHLVVRTPTNPTYYWGNFLLLPAPPAAGDVQHWLAEHRREFPDAAHTTLGIDRFSDREELEPLRAAGMRLDVPVTMTADRGAPTATPRHRRGAASLPVTRTGPAWWTSRWQVRTTRTSAATSSTRKTDSYRGLVGAGLGHWWGGFVDGRLVASMGIFRAGEGLARFQSVKTHPDHRGRGIAGTLVHAASRDALETLGARTLVMVADPDYLAIRVYRSVGFTEGGAHAEATLVPPVREPAGR